MLTIYILIVIIGIVILGIGAYIAVNFLFPKKVEELARMLELGQIGAAIKGLHELLEKDDRDPYIHFLLAEGYYLEGNIQHAIVEYRQVLKLNLFAEPYTETAIRSKLAKLYRETGALDDAKKEYLLLTKIDESNFENYYNLGVLFFNASYMEKSLQYFKKSVALNPKHSLSYFYLGQIQFRNKLMRDAKDSLIKCVSLDPRNYKAHYFLGMVLRHVSDYESAIKEFDIAIKDDDIRVKAIIGKGLCLFDQKQFSQSQSEFKRCLTMVNKFSESDYNVRYYLALSAEKMRDLHTAIENWEYILKNKPDFRDVAQKLKDYNEFRVDDRLKDFMIASPAQFENMTQNLIESMGYTIVEMKMLNEAAIDILATEQEGKFRNMRKSNRIIKVRRITDPIQETYVKQLHEDMKTNNANLGIFITAGDFTQAARNFAQSRPVDLLDRNELSRLFKSMDRNISIS